MGRLAASQDRHLNHSGASVIAQSQKAGALSGSWTLNVPCLAQRRRSPPPCTLASIKPAGGACPQPPNSNSTFALFCFSLKTASWPALYALYIKTEPFISPRGGTVVNPNMRISARVFVVPAGSSIPAAESWGSNSLLPRLFFLSFFFFLVLLDLLL